MLKSLTQPILSSLTSSLTAPVVVGIPPSALFDFSSSFDADATHTRATTATFYNAAALLSTAAIDVARIQTDPTVGGRGYLAEDGATNIIAYSEDFKDSSWSKIGGSVQDSTDGVTELSPDGNICRRVSQRLQRNVTIVAGNPYTYETIIKKDMDATWSYRIDLEGKVAIIDFDLDAVTATRFTGGGNYTQDDFGIEALGDGWFRCWQSVTSTTETSPTLRIQISTSSSNFNFVFSCSVTDTSLPTSYIKTSGSSVAKSADIVSIPAVTSTLGTCLIRLARPLYRVGEISGGGDYALLGEPSSQNNNLVAYPDGEIQMRIGGTGWIVMPQMSATDTVLAFTWDSSTGEVQGAIGDSATFVQESASEFLGRTTNWEKIGGNTFRETEKPVLFKYVVFYDVVLTDEELAIERQIYS